MLANIDAAIIDRLATVAVEAVAVVVGADIDLIEMKGVVDVGIGSLREAASMITDAAGEGHAYLVERYVVVGVVMLGGRLAGAGIIEKAQAPESNSRARYRMFEPVRALMKSTHGRNASIYGRNVLSVASVRQALPRLMRSVKTRHSMKYDNIASTKKR